MKKQMALILFISSWEEALSIISTFRWEAVLDQEYFEKIWWENKKKLQMRKTFQLGCLKKSEKFFHYWIAQSLGGINFN